mmetsp:Transcript_33649/g.82743  ORF Transcript_33649/g.82743 Transcript_33649/m.82743 type:complete len:317 (-) Transcript_33649:300-1250(-)
MSRWCASVLRLAMPRPPDGPPSRRSASRPAPAPLPLPRRPARRPACPPRGDEITGMSGEKFTSSGRRAGRVAAPPGPRRTCRRRRAPPARRRRPAVGLERRLIEKQSAEDGKGAPPVCAPPPPLRMRSAGPGKPEDMLSPWPGPPRRRRKGQRVLTKTLKKGVFRWARTACAGCATPCRTCSSTGAGAARGAPPPWRSRGSTPWWTRSSGGSASPGASCAPARPPSPGTGCSGARGAGRVARSWGARSRTRRRGRSPSWAPASRLASLGELRFPRQDGTGDGGDDPTRAKEFVPPSDAPVQAGSEMFRGRGRRPRR